jgi:hypothetical protein
MKQRLGKDLAWPKMGKHADEYILRVSLTEPVVTPHHKPLYQW